MNEKWIKWEISKKIDHKYYFKSIKHSKNKIIIVIVSSKDDLKNKIKIKFDSTVKSYRFCNEHCRINLVAELRKKYGDDFIFKWNYFIVKESEYINQLSKSFANIHETIGLKHYVLMDSETILDIITKNEPTIEIIKE